MSILVKINTQAVINELREGTYEVIQAAKAGLLQGMRFFESHIVKTQMTGRKHARYGLNVITGNLRASWYTQVTKQYNDFTVATRTSTKYAIAHERPPGYSGTPHIPKRLHIYKTFERRGYQFINEGMVKNLSRFVRLR